MSAPTEAEIRAAIEARFSDTPEDVYQRFQDHLPGVIETVFHEAAAPLVDSAANTLGDGDGERVGTAPGTQRRAVDGPSAH